jgi:hypothetical protein
MLSFLIRDKAKLIHYVLHAKHSKIDQRGKLDKFIGEDFEDIVNEAYPFIITNSDTITI